MNMLNHINRDRAFPLWLLRSSLILLFMVALCSSLEAAGGMHRVETSHYVVETDIDQRFTKIVSQHMEEIYEEYQRRFREYDLQDHDRFNVKVFQRRRDYEQAVPKELAGSAGAFVSNQKLLAACMEDQTAQRVFETLYHEGFHQFLFSCIRADVPLWVNEGFAEYFAESVWNGQRFRTGKVPSRRLYVLKQAAKRNELLPFKRLFMMENEGWLANVRSGEASVQYTQAWSIIHFLCHARGGRYRKRLLRYLKMLSEGKDRDKSYKACFGTDVKSFQQAWVNYIKQLEPSHESRCRMNMRLLMQLGQKMLQGARNFTSLKKLRSRLFSDRIRWQIRTQDGREIKSSDKEAVSGLFKCPSDNSRRKSSYILLRNANTGLPELFCIHHAGNVMRAYYDTGQGGRGQTVRVERVVKETLPSDIVNAIKRKIR